MKRRDFIQHSVAAGAALGLGGILTANASQSVIRIGIIGLDTSHAPAFTKIFNIDSGKAEWLPLTRMVARISKAAFQGFQSTQRK